MPKERTCPECGDRFMPFQSFQQVCLKINCAISHSAKKRAKKEAKEYKAETTKLKQEYRTTDKSYLTKKAQEYCNKYVRLRDKGRDCVSCGKPDNGMHQRHASHFRSRGAASQLKYNEYNIHASCSKCNVWLSANLEGYLPELINRIGQSHYEFIKNNNESYSYSIDELLGIIEYYKSKLKEFSGAD